MNTEGVMTMASFNLNMPLRPVGSDIQQIDWQLKTVEETIDKLTSPRKVGLHMFDKGLYGVMLRAGTGVGKMYIKAWTIRLMAERKLIKMPEGSNNPFPVIWVIPANILIQTQRCLNSFGVAHLVHLMTYHAFRSNSNPYVTWKDVGINEELLVPHWKPEWLPAIVIMDECQNLRNPSTSTTQVAISLVDATHRHGVKLIYASATPYQRLCEARCVAVTLGVVTKYNTLPLVNENFPSWADSVAAHGKSMYDYSPKSMENLRETLDLWYVEPKGVKFKFPAKTLLLEIDLTPEKREKYDAAYAEYLRKIWELQRRTGPQGILAKWVALGKFQEAAELLRADELADRAFNHVGNKFQVIVGSKYTNTLRAVKIVLTEKYGVAEDDISFIIGGQTKEKRQINVDAFQAGATKYMLLMMKAGGVGISLHHDRPSKHSWPRKVLLPPTYAAPELVQVLGRGHRLTSLSPTEQEVIWYRGTVEADKVLPKVRVKLRCLDAAVVAKEQWGSMLEDNAEADADEKYGEGYTELTEKENAENEEQAELENLTGEGLSNEE